MVKKYFKPGDEMKSLKHAYPVGTGWDFMVGIWSVFDGQKTLNALPVNNNRQLKRADLNQPVLTG